MECCEHVRGREERIIRYLSLTIKCKIGESMVLESIFKKKEPTEDEGEEFIELETEGEDRRKVNIRIENLNDYRDVEEIQKLLREGNIVFLKIKKIRDRDIGELKRSVERLRKTSIAMNGDIVGIDEDYLVLVPPFAKIYRGQVEGVKPVQ
jgi:SepF-like predicted cell division protein (DUF552 family)